MLLYFHTEAENLGRLDIVSLGLQELGFYRLYTGLSFPYKRFQQIV